jgi:hypothetical protein
MAKVIKKVGFQLPKIGPQRGIFARENYLGFQTNPRHPEWGAKEKVRFTFQLEERGPDGKRLLFEEILTLSLADVAPLLAITNALAGGDAGIAIGQEVDTAELLGRTCLINFVHKPPDSKNRVWPKAVAYMPLPDTMTALELEPLPSEKTQPADAAVQPTARQQPTVNVTPEPPSPSPPPPQPAASTWHLPKRNVGSN